MPIDFQLSSSEADVREAAQALARQVLQPARSTYIRHKDQKSRFQAIRPTYEVALACGVVNGLLVPVLGGRAGSIVEMAILVEECYAVETSAALTIFSTALGLIPFSLGNISPVRSRPYLSPFLESFSQPVGDGRGHAPLASFAFSERNGVADFIEKGAPGLETTARRIGDEWEVDGEKQWATNAAGWDFKGADVICVVCRDITSEETPVTSDSPDQFERVAVIIVTRADLERNGPGAFRVLRHVSTMGHDSVSCPHVRFNAVRVPATNVLATGRDAVNVVFGSLDWTAVLVSAQAVGLMRAAFEAGMAIGKSDDGRGRVPLLERQSFSDLLVRVKMNIDACRLLTWKAANAMELGPGDYASRRETTLSAKTMCSESAVDAVRDIINAVGIPAYDADQPFQRLLNDAMALSIYDGGNVGVRRRHMQRLMLSPSYDPWASTYGPSSTSNRYTFRRF